MKSNSHSYGVILSNGRAQIVDLRGHRKKATLGPKGIISACTAGDVAVVIHGDRTVHTYSIQNGNHLGKLSVKDVSNISGAGRNVVVSYGKANWAVFDADKRRRISMSEPDEDGLERLALWMDSVNA